MEQVSERFCEEYYEMKERIKQLQTKLGKAMKCSDSPESMKREV